MAKLLMKLGLGLYRHMLTRENFQFARQAGATHIVAHLVDYFQGRRQLMPISRPAPIRLGTGRRSRTGCGCRRIDRAPPRINAAGLELEAIENFDPAHWHDVLLDGPKKRQHLENIKTIIRRVGEAGIPMIGYNFSIAGVCGRVTRAIRPWRSSVGRHGRPIRYADAPRHGVEHGVRSVKPRRAPCPR